MSHTRTVYALLWLAMGPGCGGADGGSMDAGAPADASHDVGDQTLDADEVSADAGTDALDSATGFDDAGELAYVSFDEALMDTDREREVGARVVFPLGTSGPHSLVLISHGGFGAANGEALFDHLGGELASAGFVAVQIGHRRSTSNDANRIDRPADVSFLIDALADGSLALPANFGGTVDTDRVGHTGHSAGAYTAHAVAGAEYPYGTFRDPRVAAIAPISPQGVGDEFEAFDDGPAASTWTPVTLPVLVLLGGSELDTNGAGVFVENDWRLRPFLRYPDDADRFQAIVTGQEHIDMGAQGDDDVKAFVARNIREFFTVYLRAAGDACAIGMIDVPMVGLSSFERRPAASESRVERCP